MALSNGPRCDYQPFKWVKSMDPYEQLLKIDSNHPHPFKMGKGSLLKIGSLFRVKANKLSTLPGCFPSWALSASTLLLCLSLTQERHISILKVLIRAIRARASLQTRGYLLYIYGFLNVSENAPNVLEAIRKQTVMRWGSSSS